MRPLGHGLRFLTGSIVQILVFFLLVGCASSLPYSSPSPIPEDMVYIPGGSFTMGSGQEDGKIGFEIGVDELPRHRVRVSGFFIDRFEVSEADYYQFLVSTGKKKFPGYWREAGREDRYPDGYQNYPVSDIDWYDADEYCRWLGKRLPTEAEWEKAARGTDGRLWPWGNEKMDVVANTQETSKDWEAPRGQKNQYGWKAPIGAYPRDLSPYGIHDMAGNVREWTSSSYRSYPGNPVKETKEIDRFKILRGGSYLTPMIHSRAAFRVAVVPTIGPSESDGWHSDYTYGFRCAR